MNTVTRLILAFNLFIPLVSHAEIPDKFNSSYLLEGYQLYKKDHNTIYQQSAPAAFSGYVRGIATVLTAEKEICISDTFDINQVFDTVGNWLKNKPEERNNPPAMIVAEALVEKYPCSS
ncbi:Rap1a/Tai family immunity protein [Citrobacter freundii]|uniref:Rap1a/Tai family immunity protein n=1 Tax=unclassified Citrobacter TaxID=2644389 RepID=UPI0005F0BB25|nr:MULTISPECIES: Rap1a/Tai family immunity protein [Citrobacter]MBJ9596405.1 hypothetical protein [Citrobacter werkmanii]MBJ9873777.1 hypothetical protein [Citrobacter werkmanii]MDK2361351.1 Rap1a/Tai family immunity protein [Citrobacter freundii]MDM2930233.1 Rap1a/Tai family immunity protein [Citrobacter sp. Cm046]MDM2942448.1 Rap1a/Tai family immunity protein [Citrobacter sp. Cm038]